VQLAALPTARPNTRPLDARPTNYRLQANMHGLIVTADESPPSLLQLLSFITTYMAIATATDARAIGTSCGLERSSAVL